MAQRTFGTLHQAWEMRELAGLEGQPIRGFNRVGKIVLESPGHEYVEQDPEDE